MPITIEFPENKAFDEIGNIVIRDGRRGVLRLNHDEARKLANVLAHLADRQP